MTTDRAERKPRRCLRCAKMFPSQHAGNRICLACVRDPLYQECLSGVPHLRAGGMYV